MTSVETLRAPETALPTTAAVGEGPVIDARTGRLCWVDITAGELHETILETQETRTVSVGMTLGAAVPRTSRSGFAVAVADGFGFADLHGLELVDVVLPEPFRRMNDAKCDSHGRLWAGSTHLDFAPGEGALHRWDGRAPSEVMADGITLPNGIGWSPDDALMYLVDSMAREVLVADFSAEAGTVGAFRTLCRVESGLPDGLAVDVDGCLWVAVWGGSVVQKYTAEGELVAECPMPVTQPSSCAFADDGTLYITSARAGLSDDELVEQPLAGSIFALETNTRGVPVGTFNG